MKITCITAKEKEAIRIAWKDLERYKNMTINEAFYITRESKMNSNDKKLPTNNKAVKAVDEDEEIVGVFKSIGAAARYEGTSHATLLRRIRNKEKVNGITWKLCEL